VTKGDRVVLGFESTGIWGALSYFAERRSTGAIEPGTQIDHRVLSDLLEAEEGVSLRIRQTNPGRNERGRSSTSQMPTRRTSRSISRRERRSNAARAIGRPVGSTSR